MDMHAIVDSFRESLQEMIDDHRDYLLFIILMGVCACVLLYLAFKDENEDDEPKEVSENSFNTADLDNDGVISTSEAAELFRIFGLPNDLLDEIWNYVDQNKTGNLSNVEFYNALRLVTVAQRNGALTPDVVKSALYGPDAAKILPPDIKPTGHSLLETSQRRSSSSRHPESDPTETASAENRLKMELDQKEKLHQKEIEEIRARAEAKANRHQREIEKLRLEIQRLRDQQDDNLFRFGQLEQQNQKLIKQLSDSQLYCVRLKQERDDATKKADELSNQKQFSIYSDKSLSSQYSSNELKRATKNFSESLKIGEGGFGCVYKGSLRKTTVAIKKLNSESLQGVSQFQQEIAILSKVRHPHLVNLIGSCSEISALVYEFLPNGSLEDRLVCKDGTPSLTWQTRTRIVSEMCLALIFLHSSKPYLVIHGDLKPDNILLDANFMSKLSDFGISRIIKQPDSDTTACHHTTHLAGTFAYIDPELSSTGELTPKSDVYSFGIIVLRLLTGKPPQKIVSVVQEAMQSGRFQSVIDGSAGKWPVKLAEEVAELGLRCANMLRKNRPDMVQVWATIEPLMKVVLQSPEFSSNVNVEHIPLHFICPISQEIMEDPCVAADGFTYEAKVIKEWFNTGHNTSPMTNLVLPHLDLIPNLVLRSAIQEWQEHHTRI